MRLDLSGPRPRLDLDNPALLLTPDQQRAMRFDRELVVTAGAGAGKTHTLALRYTALLLELAAVAVEQDPRRPRPSIEGVLVLTFTEKAAEEMSERCYRRLTALAGEVRRSAAALDARYGAGYGPGLSAAIDQLLERFDRARIGTFHGFCARLLREFPAETGTAPGFVVLTPLQMAPLEAAAVDDVLTDLRQRPADLGLLLDAFGSVRQLRRAVLAGLRERDRIDWAPPPLLPALPTGELRAWLEGVGKRVIAAVITLAGPGEGSALGPVRDVHARLQRDWLDAELPGLYRDTLDVLLNADDAVRCLSHHTVVGPKARWRDRRRYRQAKAALDVLAGRIADWPERARVARRLASERDTVLARVLAVLAPTVGVAVHTLQQGLAEADAVDFTELQARAIAAVTTSASLRGLLRRRFRYLMVDEFQDTDRAQWSLVRALGREADHAEDRIFLVGDPKQAIYGFRGGDVTVFGAAIEELGAEVVRLPDNFRSRPVLIEWFNRFFPDVFGAGTNPWEVAYAPLRPGRPADGGSITLLHGEPEGLWEPEAVARLLAAEVLSARGAFEGVDLSGDTPPVAVLLRTRTHLPAYEQALADLGIPYVVGRGVGFWGRPEVLDVVNALHAIATGDPTSLVGWLRSPLLSWTEQEVHDIVLTGQIATLLDDDPRLARLVAASRSLPVPALVHAILADGAAAHAWALQGSADHSRANVMRLATLAADMEGQGHDLPQIASFFVDQVMAGARESEAALVPTEARVILLTVHAAKGLEFPVVVVPGLDRSPRASPPPLRLARLDGVMRVACTVLDPASPVQKRVRPGLLEHLSDVVKAQEEAESLRLLYVAATRARDHLVLVGSDRERAWMEHLVDHDDDDVQRRTRAEVMELEPPQIRVEPASAVLPGPDTARAIGPFPGTVEIEVAPSSLAAFAACPARWVRRQVLRVPEPTRAADPTDLSAETLRRLGGLMGDVLHGVLEDDLAHDADAAEARWQAALGAAGLEAPSDRLHRHLATAAEDPFVRAALDAPGHAELDFRIRHGNVVLNGQIDRLYTRDDQWVVLDWKSETLRGRSPEAAAHHHADQLLAYAWAASRVLVDHGQPPVRTAEVYFTETGEVVELSFDEADIARFEALLDRVGAAAVQSWRQLEAEATARPDPSPCRSCGYLGRGCAGRAGAYEDVDDIDSGALPVPLSAG